MEQPAISILNGHRIMAVSTVRPDGWPQTTFVGYANEGFDLFFLILRSSQKFANIALDNRVAIAVGEEPGNLDDLQAVYASAHARELTGAEQREHAWRLLTRRHPNLKGFELPDPGEAAMMHARCEHVSVLDFLQGFGHREEITLAGAPIAGEAQEVAG
jgi:nitroimidazol reductase NimA-like FMN-containing flavoprotein (pyridoxamine 5'-phosphate oxidase superfamily)